MTATFDTRKKRRLNRVMDALGFEYSDYEKLDEEAGGTRKKGVVSILKRQAIRQSYKFNFFSLIFFSSAFPIHLMLEKFCWPDILALSPEYWCARPQLWILLQLTGMGCWVAYCTMALSCRSLTLRDSSPYSWDSPISSHQPLHKNFVCHKFAYRKDTKVPVIR